jgi:hypothetical protein
MLGHPNIASTQIYTRVSLRKLEAIHSASHPGAGMSLPAPAERTMRAKGRPASAARRVANDRLLNECPRRSITPAGSLS